MLPRLFAALAAATLSLPAAALDLGALDAKPLRLDITASTVSAWHADNRNSLVIDDGYGELQNRINLQFAWWKLVGSLRLDTSTFANRPDPIALAHQASQNAGEVRDLVESYKSTLAARYQDAFWIGKASLSFLSPALEVTVGDSYVSFGRGLALSLRKQDELAVDNTLFGAKVLGRVAALTLTGVAGIANPVRVDEATGQTLFANATDYYSRRPLGAFIGWPLNSVQGASSPLPEQVYGDDFIFGARAEGKVGPVGVGAHAVRLYRQDLLSGTAELRAAQRVDLAGATLSGPLGTFGSAWLEGAWQRYPLDGSGERFRTGWALYGSASAGAGPLTGLVELQHYSNFQALLATVNTAKAPAFIGLRYSAPPTTEPAINDTRFNNFDQCVTGGRARLDGRVAPPLMVYGTFGQWATFSERGNTCAEGALRNDVSDATVGVEYVFDERRSQSLASAGIRRDTLHEDGQFFYREFHAELTLNKSISGPWSAELAARHRRRFEVGSNIDKELGDLPWSEGDVYLALKYSPTLVATVGYEYTTWNLYEPHYFNGQLLWKYRPDSSVKFFAGQQRGALKCISGSCRYFPAFEGVKLEWIQRY